LRPRIQSLHLPEAGGIGDSLNVGSLKVYGDRPEEAPMISASNIHRLVLGHFTRPGTEAFAGHQIVVAVYLVPYGDRMLLFDSGIGEGDPAVDELYQVVRRPFLPALAELGVRADDVLGIVNCHLHFDHCGGNVHLPGRPIFVQQAELQAAHEADYTLPSLIDFSGATYEAVRGETEILPGVRLLPTAGHVAGHQSLVVSCEEGPVVLAGQAYDDASGYARADFACRLARSGGPGPVAEHPAWVRRLQELEPYQVLFAHDLAIWMRERPQSRFASP
jgi:glyoxylase-like metal-dependent hydrolase (beta-lactamase superfamily II)